MDSINANQNIFNAADIDEDDTGFWSQQRGATDANFETGWNSLHSQQTPSWPGQYIQAPVVSPDSANFALYSPSLESSLASGDSTLEDPDWWKQWDNMELPDLSSISPDYPNPFGDTSQQFYQNQGGLNLPQQQYSSYQPLNPNFQSQIASGWGGMVVMQPILENTAQQSPPIQQNTNYQPLDNVLQAQIASGWGGLVVMRPTALQIAATNPLRTRNRRDSASLRTSRLSSNSASIPSHQRQRRFSHAQGSVSSPSNALAASSTAIHKTNSHASRPDDDSDSGGEKAKRKGKGKEKEKASPPGQSTTATKPNSASHSTTEQKYRRGINDKFASLLDVLSPELVNPNLAGSGSAEEPEKAVTKIEVLDLAKKQIGNLEREKEELEQQARVLKGQLEMFKRLVGGAGIS